MMLDYLPSNFTDLICLLRYLLILKFYNVLRQLLIS